MKLDELLGQLDHAGLQALVLTHAAGGKIVVTPHGGRVLGLFTYEDGENAFWVNPELQSAQTAKRFLSGEHVLGGDRLWIAPERGLFFKGDRLADGVVTQSSIDPGNWLVGQRTGGSVRVANEFSASYFHMPGSMVRGIVERSLRRISSPFHHAPGVLAELSRIHYVGYEVASTFRLLEAPKDDLHFGMWFLIQLVVPKGGYLYAPTSGKAVITGDYYEPTGPDYLRVTDNHVRFKLDSVDRHKIGIRKTEVLGRAAFLSNPGGAGGQNATLVVRNFLNNPSGHYSDVPLHTPEGTQDSIQSYNHNTGPGGFGELEFHSPGINRAMAEPVVTDVNQVWAFTGRREDLVPVASRLLNLPPDTFAV
jgi:hypothetical protein